MKKYIGYLLKFIIAAVISLVLLSLFSLAYYNPPIATEQSDLITNYKFIPNSNWSFMLEGAGFGKTNNQGYNSSYYKDCPNPDIIFVGSSQMEALNVPEDANCVYLLNEKFDKDDLANNDFKCMNIGISGHFFEVSASNFQYIGDRFKGAKYLVLEVPNVEFSPSMLDEIQEGKFHTPLKKRGFIYETAQKIPFVRLMYKKFNEARTANFQGGESANAESSSDNDDVINIYTDKMNKILSKISKMSAENNIETVILMHERFWEDKERNIVTEMNETYKNAFIECCKTNDIKVIDASPFMIDNYRENFEFSYGFSNSAPGEGHLNKTGHRIIADVVYKKINEMEAER